MSTDIKVPTLGESVTTATVARWLKKAGEAVAADEPLVELETDKVTVEVNAPSAGTLESVTADEGAEVAVGGLLGTLAEGDGAAQPAARGEAPAKPEPPKAEAAPAANPPAGVNPPPPPTGPVARPAVQPLPAAAKMMTEQQVSAEQLGTGTGRDGRITKGDVLDFLSRPAPSAPVQAARQPRAAQEGEERVKMTRLRRTIAQRLKEAQNTAAMLTTFNEVDMTAAQALRAEYREAFEKRHAVRLGFMSLFVRACVAALKEFPAVNAEIDGDEIVYKHHVLRHRHRGRSTERGLVVPVVIRHADAHVAGRASKSADRPISASPRPRQQAEDR